MEMKDTSKWKSPLAIGFTGTYIQDYEFEHVMQIPARTALVWVQDVAPDCVLGRDKPAASVCYRDNCPDDPIPYWLNKLFVVVAEDHGVWYAINNHDGNFSLYKRG